MPPIEPAVRDLGFALYDVELLGGTGARTLRVTVTRDAGVDLEAITAVTQAVSPIIDEADAVPGSYLLEVSSPGIERTLRRPEHFHGAVGEEVSIKVRADGVTRRVHGILEGCRRRRLPRRDRRRHARRPRIDDITQARTIFAWGPAQPRRPRPRKSGKAAEKQRGEAIA